MSHYTEILDLVSEQDEVIGTMPRHEVHAKKLHNFRGVNGFIINAKGQLWIPRRQATKELFPLALDMSIGGHVSSGETYAESFIREAEEEVGITLKLEELVILGRLTPHEHGTSAFMYVYIIECNETPNYNTQDFIESFWLYPDEILTLINNGEKSKGDLPIILRVLAKELTQYRKI